MVNDDGQLSMLEARKLADYYGRILLNKNGTLWSKDDILEFTEALFYCRHVILKGRIKR